MQRPLSLFLVAMAGLFWPMCVAAGPDRVSVLLGTDHVGATRSFEEFNPGVFLTWERAALDKRVDIGVGLFRNSYGDASIAATAAYPLVRKPIWGIDLFAALAWYPGNGDQFEVSFGDIVPIGGLQARYRNLFVQAIPSGGTAVDATLTFGLTFPFESK